MHLIGKASFLLISKIYQNQHLSECAQNVKILFGLYECLKLSVNIFVIGYACRTRILMHKYVYYIYIIFTNRPLQT